MPNTYTPIGSATVAAGGVASVTLSAIPQIYNDLLIKISSQSSTGSSLQYLTVSPNNSTSITFRNIVNEGSTTVSSYSSSGYGGGVGNIITGATTGGSVNTFNNLEMYFPNYADATSQKAYSVDSVTGNSQWGWLGSNLYGSTSAITSIVVSAASGLAANTTIYLYGIKNS